MTRDEHRNVRNKHFCPRCEHYHHLPNSNVPNATGVCLLNPPTPFIVGMVAVTPAIARENAPVQQVPVIRGYYPPVGPGDTCAQWTPRAEGDA